MPKKDETYILGAARRACQIVRLPHTHDKVKLHDGGRMVDVMVEMSETEKGNNDQARHVHDCKLRHKWHGLQRVEDTPGYLTGEAKAQAIIAAIGQASKGERIRPRENNEEGESDRDARRRRLMKEVGEVPPALKERYGTTKHFRHCRENDYVMGQFNKTDTLEYIAQQGLDNSDDDNDNDAHGNYIVGGSSGSNGNQ